MQKIELIELEGKTSIFHMYLQWSPNLTIDFFPFWHSIYLPENSKIEQIVNGSIRSASTVSSRDCERNANLVR